MSTTAVGTALLQVEELWAGYGPIQVLHGVTFEVNLGEVVVILGANGAGKTTTLRAICQMIHTRGRVDLDGKSLIGRSTTTVVRRVAWRATFTAFSTASAPELNSTDFLAWSPGVRALSCSHTST